MLVTAGLRLAVGAPGSAYAFEPVEACAKGTKILGLQAMAACRTMSSGSARSRGSTSSASSRACRTCRSCRAARAGTRWHRAGGGRWLQYSSIRVGGGGRPQGVAPAARDRARTRGPDLEGTGGAGATGLDITESRSTFTFILEGGGGVSVFVAPRVALNLGYRLQHASNGNTSRPNRGYNANTGVLGVSFFFH